MPVAGALISGALVSYVGDSPLETQRIGRANRDTGSAVIAFLAKIITQWIKPKLTNPVAFGAIVTGNNVSLDSKHTESTQ
jgi:hypothetical protein